ncbi:cytochrome P450 [Pyrenophora seminiperda CCB06]|uniref:Cytochrome P450 n=1 Tax=Pyrenophora seminiperda CCB06 TaxID=1302712 RepID=A0A3M7MBW8_9PLEO|nr:cytochrome P450 [Pyrenophora seminiperda CCB06]
MSSAHHDEQDKTPVSTLQVNRDAEGLQVDYHAGGLHPDPMKKHHPDDKYVSLHDNAGLMPMEPVALKSTTVKHRRERICGIKRRAFFIVLAVVMLVVLVAAVGGGEEHSNADKVCRAAATLQPKDQILSIPTSEDQGESAEDPQVTTFAVTSGTTGIAERPCTPAYVTPRSKPQATPRNVADPYVATGATFNITCRRVPPVNAPLENFKVLTEYTFKDCMDKCAGYIHCKGVVYGANLTDMVADDKPGGNCLLKNATWDASRPPGKFWMASGVKV